MVRSSPARTTTVALWDEVAGLRLFVSEYVVPKLALESVESSTPSIVMVTLLV